MMRIFCVIQIIIILMANPSYSYEVPNGISVSKEDGKYVIYIKGDIQSGDATVVDGIFKEAIEDSSRVEIVLIDSVGGSVSDAIDIGRMARSWDSWTRISGYCYSSCTLVYVGGSIRFTASDAVLGLHRPYFAVQPGGEGPTTDSVDGLYGEVKLYLEEMNISPKFFDAMMAVSPSDMKLIEGWSSIEEWVPMHDPVYDEVSVASQARGYGIGTIDYRSIDSFDFYPLCESLGKVGDDRSICVLTQRMAAMWGVSADHYDKVEEWDAIARKDCKLSDADIEKLRQFSADKKRLALEMRSPKPYRDIDMAPERLKFQECVIKKMRSM
jgi:hypothetical protein